MRNIKIVLAVLLVILGFAMCTKKPVPCFTIVNKTYIEKDTLVFSNCSEHGKYYDWDFGDGQTSTETNPIHYYFQAGTYTITLSERSKSLYSVKQYSTTKTVTIVKAVRGCMDPNSFNYNPNANVDDGSCTNPGTQTFYFTDPSYRIIEMNVDNQYVGKDTVCFSSSAPDCATAPGCIKVVGAEGAHTYDAYFYDQIGTLVKSTHSTFTISAGTCELFVLN